MIVLHISGGRWERGEPAEVYLMQSLKTVMDALLSPYASIQAPRSTALTGVAHATVMVFTI